MAHAERQGVDRGVFNSAKEARQALRSMKKEITKNGFPEGTINDPSNANRVLVPIGNNGRAVYHVQSNGTARLKTVLINKGG